MKIKKNTIPYIIFGIFIILLILNAVGIFSPQNTHTEPPATSQSEKTEVEAQEYPYLGFASWYDYDCIIWDVVDASYESWAKDKPGAEVLCKTDYCDGEKKRDGKCWSQNHYTCASRDFPRGTFLWVEVLQTGGGIGCQVNDVVDNPDVIIDLSSKAFKHLAPLSRGIISVSVSER